MNCYKCATPLPDDARFCLSCGTDVSGEHSAERTLHVETDPELMAKLQAELGTEYVLERELGRGGMAIVFLGHDAHLGRKIAVKMLPPELTFGSRSIIERFKREARTAATLDHPNIIPVHRVSPGGKLFWYVMKYLEGEALNDILEREGQLAVDRAVDIIRQVADALDYAHKKNVVHRDIKPANVMVDEDGRVTVTDFGIAKALDANTLTASGSMIGTPYYMSPEQCSGKRVGPASDQYSLAIMTYQMLGGHVPFTGESVVDIVHKHVMEPVPPLGVLRPNLPDAVVTVVERALAKHPDERFRTCSDFARALDGAAQGFDVTLAPPGKAPAARMSKTALVSPVPGALRTAKAELRSRSRALALAIGGGVVVIGTALAVLRPWEQRPAAQQAEPAVRTDLAAADSVRQMPAAATGVDTAPTATAAPPPVAAPPTPTRPATRPPQTAVPPPRATPTQPRAQPAVLPQAQPQPAPVQRAPAETAAAAAGPAYISVGSVPLSSITINGRPAPGNPVTRFEVTAGRVVINFRWTDSTGAHTYDTVVTVAPGEVRNLRRVQLRSP